MLLYLASIFTFNVLAHGMPVDDPILEAIDNGYLFQGDMIMSKHDIQTAIKGGDVDKSYGYGVSKSLYRRWTNGVDPYVIDSSVTGIKGMWLTEKAIQNGIAAWEAKTCIRFKKRTNEKDYIEFFSDGFGKCWSYVGRSGGKQRISVGFGCFTTGIAIHEIGHALGLHHEQSRPDRDNYVEIVWDNIKSDNKFNFKKYSHSSIDSRGSPYDYDSIMHYEWNAFAKFPYLISTIKAKKNGVKFGQRSHVSVQDAIQINKYYECKKQ